MRRKLLSVVLCVCMMMTMAPFAFAEEGDGNEGTPTPYTTDITDTGASTSTLQSQINSASSPTTIKLEQNYTDTITIPEGKTITLDLNGHNLTVSTGDAIVNKGTLTITGNGQVNTTATDSAAIANFPDAVANVNGGTYTSDKWYVIKNLGTMTINGAVTVQKPNGSQDTSSLIDNGWADPKGQGKDTVAKEDVSKQLNSANLTIKSGNFKGNSGQKSCSVVKNDDGGILNISGGTFNSTANDGAENATTILNWNVATISGGTFTGSYPLSNGNYGDTYDKGELTVTGGKFTASLSLFGQNRGATSGKGFIKISGGEFNATTLGADFTYTVSISGGTFSAELSYLADGYTAKSSNGKYLVVPQSADNAVAQISNTYYNTLADAVADAGNGQTIKILNDTHVANEISFSGKTITLDLNGKTIAGEFQTYSSVIEASGEGATIIVEDNSNGAQGKITSNHYGLTGRDGGTITVNSGTIETGDGAALSGNNTTGNMNFIVNGGTLTTKQGPAIYQPGQCALTITGGTLNGGISLRMGQVNISGGTINAMTDVNAIDMPQGKVSGKPAYTYPGNVWFPDALYVIGGTYTSEDTTYGNSLNLNITGGTFNCTNGKGSAIAIYDLGKVAQTAKVTISGNAKFSTNAADRNAYDVLKLSDIGVTNPETGYNQDNLIGKVSSSISGGYFTSDPTAYLATGKTAVESDLAGYNYKVADKTSTPATVVAATPSVDTSKISETQQQTATEIANQLKADNNTVSGDGLTAAASTIANNNTVTTDQGKTALNDRNISAETSNTRIVVQTYMDIDITAIDSTSDKKTLTLDITPMYRTVATTATNDAEIILAGSSTTGEANAVPIGPANKLVINKPVTVKIPLPTNFVTANNDGSYPKVYVQHKGHEYTATVTKDTNNNLIATFTNPDGFSPFTISTDPTAVATIGDNRYTTLQAAVDAAQDNDTITLLKDTNENITVSKAVKFTLANKDHLKGTISAGSRYSMTTADVEGNTKYTFTYVGGGSSSSGTTTTYNVNVNAATNGTVAADKKTAAKGTTVTVTATPSAGYVVDSVKVVDKDGKDVAVTVKDGKYVFTMPGSAVTVTGTFKAETPAPSGLPFVDVKNGDWFYGAVKYAYENGLMTGTSATTFAPNGTMNRAMIVTVLYRLEKSPAVTGASKFTDVPAGQWYSDAVAWAAANKIVNGYSETSFGPMNAVTREQLAAILFRYEQYKGLENVTLEENLNRFPDHDKVSGYAVPAMQWAVGQKIINGNADGTLDPTGTATRAQVAQILTNLLNK